MIIYSGFGSLSGTDTRLRLTFRYRRLCTGHVEHVVEDVEVDFGALIAAAREAGARLQTLAATAAN